MHWDCPWDWDTLGKDHGGREGGGRESIVRPVPESLRYPAPAPNSEPLCAIMELQMQCGRTPDWRDK